MDGTPQPARLVRKTDMKEKENNPKKPAEDASAIAESRIALAIERQSQMDRVRTGVRAYLTQSRQQRQELSKKRARMQSSWAIFREQVQARLQQLRNEGSKARQGFKNQKAAAAAAGSSPSGKDGYSQKS